MTTEATRPPPEVDTDDRGPVEDSPWPRCLEAHVVSPGPAPRIHGYAVEADLAGHYRFGEVVLLSLTGEVPGEAAGRAFEAAMVRLAPAPVFEAPGHAAMLARICDAETSGVVATGAIGLAEQARALLARHRGALEALGSGAPVPPCGDGCRAGPPDPGALARARLEGTGIEAPALAPGVCAEAVDLAVLHRLGLAAPWQLLTAFVTARLPALAAEAHAVAPGSFRRYPMDLPKLVYEGDR